MVMKHKMNVYVLGLLIFAIVGCSTAAARSSDADTMLHTDLIAEEITNDDSLIEDNDESVTVAIPPVFDHDDLNDSIIENEIATIELAGDQIFFQGRGASVEGRMITITSAGTYLISGILNDGQVLVDTPDEELVRLILNGVEMTSTTGAPIYIQNAHKTVITLAENTLNSLTDGVDGVLDESDEPNGVIFSQDDLTINGQGELKINGHFNHGIVSKDDLKIVGGIITVDVVNDGLKGRDSIAIKGGFITITAGGDGMQSNNDVDLEKGNIFIEDGMFVINAGEDGLQAENTLGISGGEMTITTGGGSENGVQHAGFGGWEVPNLSEENEETVSAKGLKAGNDLSITGGVFNIDSADDTIHSNGMITIHSGEFTLASGDDAIHADSALDIHGGTLNITSCYEGLESMLITIDSGEIHIVATDDGINAASGASGMDGAAHPGMAFTPMGRNMTEQSDGDALVPEDNQPKQPGQAPVFPGTTTEEIPDQGSITGSESSRQPGVGFIEEGDNALVINGGSIFIDAQGDGIDANGSITMTGGTVLVNGPTMNQNSAIDFFDAFDISGGEIIAVGSIGMAQPPSTTSSQYSVMVNLDALQKPGTIIHLVSQSGDEICTFSPTREYQSIIVSTPELNSGTTYSIFLGGTSTGSSVDGLYSGGSYLSGTEAETFTISNMVTTIGVISGGFMGGPGGRMPKRP
jgi:hypothetical protein